MKYDTIEVKTGAVSIVKYDTIKAKTGALAIVKYDTIKHDTGAVIYHGIRCGMTCNTYSCRPQVPY